VPSRSFCGMNGRPSSLAVSFPCIFVTPSGWASANRLGAINPGFQEDSHKPALSAAEGSLFSSRMPLVAGHFFSYTLIEVNLK